MCSGNFIIFIFTTVLVIIAKGSGSGYGYKFANNYNAGQPDGQSQQNAGLFWNGFRAYPQTLVQSVPIQIKFQDENDSDEDPEYMYELLFGHQVKDIEKFNRQKGCLCINRLKDPHCGSDYKVYDNGCYFECAQKRNPGLKLVNWGKC